MNQSPTFSILHSSARPDQWRKVYDDWIEKAVNSSQVEYVLCVDERWGFKQGFARNARFSAADKPGDLNITCWNEGRRCYVDGVNTAAQHSHGRILIVIADDQFACDGWDALLRAALRKVYGRDNPPEHPAVTDFVVEASTGTPDEHVRGILVMPILSRARYERLGYVFYPEYESMFADNDFCESARQDGVVIDARHLMFPHIHPMFGAQGWFDAAKVQGDLDDAYRAQNRTEAYVLGQSIIKRRRAQKFSNNVPEKVWPRALVDSEPKAAADPERLAREAAGWRADAEREYENSRYYRGIVERIGKALGPDAFTADDGSKSQDVLCGKVADLVEERLGKLSTPPRHKSIALCVPGETFRGEWIFGGDGSGGFVRLLLHLQDRFKDVHLIPGYTSNVYSTRNGIAEIALALKPDYLLWLDDDNLLSAEKFDLLLSDLEARPDVGGVFGWAWIHDAIKGQFLVSAGRFDLDGLRGHTPNPQTFPQCSEPLEVNWSGFPTVLLRREALEAAGGARAFLPIVDSAAPGGMLGEDIAFCKRAKEAGVKFLCDPRVHVPHMKWRAIEPMFEEAKSPSDPRWFGPKVDALLKAQAPRMNAEILEHMPRRNPKIIGMLRVKNEARWIERVVKALLSLCAAVYVMDDGSTDGTGLICEGIGAHVHVMYSPFQGKPLDEARDKNYLMAHIVGAENPDYIFCIDGDEELPVYDVPSIRDAIRCNPDALAFRNGFYYLWNSVNQYRCDRWYANVERMSLFKPGPGVLFKSFYQGRGVHCGLHTGNAPADLLCDSLPMDVKLIHYGYMDRAKRVSKYEYYNRIDPGNQIEDCYRHIVQGDYVSIPASAALKHAGSLELRPMPFKVEPLEPELKPVLQYAGGPTQLW